MSSNSSGGRSSTNSQGSEAPSPPDQRPQQPPAPHAPPDRETTSSRRSANSSGGVGTMEGLIVQGSEFLDNMKEALLEMGVSSRSRNEMLGLAQFLVAFSTGDKRQTLNFEQLSKLIFTLRIESVEKTRKCLFALIQSDCEMPPVRSIDGGYLVPTDTFVNYLKAKEYYKRVGVNMKITVVFSASASACAAASLASAAVAAAASSGAAVAEAAAAGAAAAGADATLAGLDRAGNNASIEPRLPFTPPLRRQDSVRTNFLPFLINMFARQVPGNLFYEIGSADGSLGDTNDFYCCIQFLQENLLRNPMNLDGIYERIWDNYLRLSQEGEKPNRDVEPQSGIARANDLQLYCQPIIGNNWSVATQKYNARIADTIDKKSFIRICQECVL